MYRQHLGEPEGSRFHCLSGQFCDALDTIREVLRASIKNRSRNAGLTRSFECAQARKRSLGVPRSGRRQHGGAVRRRATGLREDAVVLQDEPLGSRRTLLEPSRPKRTRSCYPSSWGSRADFETTASVDAPHTARSGAGRPREGVLAAGRLVLRTTSRHTRARSPVRPIRRACPVLCVRARAREPSGGLATPPHTAITRATDNFSKV